MLWDKITFSYKVRKGEWIQSRQLIIHVSLFKSVWTLLVLAYLSVVKLYHHLCNLELEVSLQKRFSSIINEGDLNESIGAHKEWALAWPRWGESGNTFCREHVWAKSQRRYSEWMDFWPRGNKVGKVNETKFQRNFLKCAPSDTCPDVDKLQGWQSFYVKEPDHGK